MTYQYGLGLLRQLPDIRDFKFALPTPTALDPVKDWRPTIFPCSDQGNEGSCTAFAVGAAFRDARRVKHQWPVPATWADSLHYGTAEDYRISEATQYWLSRSLEGTTAADAGSSIRDAVKVLHQFGACAWHNFPYVAGNYAQSPPFAAIKNAANHEVLAYHALDGSLLQYQIALMAGHKPLVGVAVYESFYQALTNGGFVPMPKPGERFLGGHAVWLVGYDANRSVFIDHNSWGPTTGDNGHLYFPFEYIADPNLTFDPWVIDVGAP